RRICQKDSKKLHGCKSGFETGMRKHKNIINSFCTFYKSSLKGCSFFIKGFKVSLHPKKKNLRRLIKYSRLFKIEDEIRKYMEVLS
ncbi:hypothetical protein HMPREF3217_01348, partial [Finegoldia magna]